MRSTDKFGRNLQPIAFRQSHLCGVWHSVNQIRASASEYPPANIVYRPVSVPMLSETMTLVVNDKNLDEKLK